MPVKSKTLVLGDVMTCINTTFIIPRQYFGTVIKVHSDLSLTQLMLTFQSTINKTSPHMWEFPSSPKADQNRNLFLFKTAVHAGCIQNPCLCFYPNTLMHIINVRNSWSGEWYLLEVLRRARPLRHSCTAAPVSSETTRWSAALHPVSADKEPWLRSGLYPYLTDGDRERWDIQRRSREMIGGWWGFQNHFKIRPQHLISHHSFCSAFGQLPQDLLNSMCYCTMDSHRRVL